MIMDIDSVPLRQQLNVIWLSKVTKNISELMKKTGVSQPNILHIIQHEIEILKEWRKSNNNLNIPPDQLQDVDGIDALLLEWVKRHKVNKIKILEDKIDIEARGLKEMLEVNSYYIRPATWLLIRNILGTKNPIGPGFVVNDNVFNARKILRYDGRKLLKNEIYTKFVAALEKNSFCEENEKNESDEDVMVIETPIKCVEISDDESVDSDNIVEDRSEDLEGVQATSRSSTQSFPPSHSIILEKKLTEDWNIKDEPQEFITEPNIGAEQVKKQLTDDQELEETSSDTISHDSSLISIEIDEEMEFLDDDIAIEGKVKENREFLDNSLENIGDVGEESYLMEIEVEENTIKTEPNGYSNNNGTCEPVAENQEVTVAYEDNSDQEEEEVINNNLMKTINKNTRQDNIKIKEEEDEADNEEVITVLEIISDSEEDCEYSELDELIMASKRETKEKQKENSVVKH